MSNFSNPSSRSDKTNHSFSSDKHASALDDERFSLLMAYAKELADAPQNQKMNVFLSIQQKANQNRISFTESERDLLLNTLTKHMSEEEKKRVELIKSLAAKLMK